MGTLSEFCCDSFCCSELSDNELAALADIVRGEMIRYELPRMVAVPQYEIIEVPDEMLEQTVLEPFPRDRRAAPMDWGDEAEEAEVSLRSIHPPRLRSHPCSSSSFPKRR